MKRAIIALTICTVFLFGWTDQSAAQGSAARSGFPHSSPPYAQQIGFHASSTPDHRAEARARTIDVGDDQFRPWPWVIGGALVGGVGLGALAAYEVSACATSDSCMFAGQYVLLAAGVGAVGGGLITLFVYSLIRGGS